MGIFRSRRAEVNAPCHGDARRLRISERGGNYPLMAPAHTLQIELPDGTTVSGLLRRSDASRALLVLAHGAGAGMRHPFMEAISDRLAVRSIATLRYQFPYMEAGGKRPDRPPLAQTTVRAAVRAGRAAAGDPGIPVFAGGKSFGGRMTSGAAAESPLEGVRALVFLGFPLHPPGRPGTDRAAHLAHLDVPMLFVQGTRDRLAGLDLLRPIVSGLGARATLHVVQDADHSFHVLKRSGRTDDQALDKVSDAVTGFLDGCLAD